MATWFSGPARRCGLIAAALIVAGCQSVEDPSGEANLANARATTTVTVTAALPDSVGRDVTLDVQVTGSGFDRGSTVAFLLNGVVQPKLGVNATKYGSGSKLTANVTIAADAPAATYDIMVTTSNGKKGIGTELFAVLPINAIPTATTIADANAGGDAAGASCPKSTTCRPFIWRGAGQPITLPIPAGACNGRAMVINQADVLAGRSNNCTVAIPLKWVPAGGSTWTMQTLGTIAGATNYWLWDINEAATIVGSYFDASGGAALVWDPNGQVRRLASPFPVAGTSEATGVNESGLISGYARSAAGYRPVVWLADGTPVPLPIPDTATYAFTQAINDVGSVVGEIGVSGGYRAAIWRPDPAQPNTWLPPVYLAPLSGNSVPNDINNADQVVGQLAGQSFYWDQARGAIPLASWSKNWGGVATAITEPDAGALRIFGAANPPAASACSTLGVWWPAP